MTAIGKGDFVEKVGDSIYALDAIPSGDVRKCIDLGPAGTCPNGHYGATIIVDGHDGHWCHCAWRPISGGQTGMFDHMLKIDAPNREHVAA